MRFDSFSEKQLTALTWWKKPSPHAKRDAIICDGAVRSGKTLCMSISFLSWACETFSGQAFAICGKTIASLRRSLVIPLIPLSRELGFTCQDKPSKNYLDIGRDGHENRFYLFGGKDEGSASLIQGVTLAGILLDEVALMPRSFVEQAMARCSVKGSKLWFNCNPEHPFHWFYREWIQKTEEKNALYLHFTMEDNPSLSPDIRARYDSLYSGRFHDRYVKGLWVQAQGLVYPGFSDELLFDNLPEGLSSFYISCDYGTVNPTSMGLWGEKGGVWYRTAEYYYDGRAEQSLRTDEEHYLELCQLAEGRAINAVVADPSAASFLECIRRHGEFRAIPAKNDVISGIRRVSVLLKEKKLRFSRSCADTIREFSLYSFDESAGDDRPKKEHDHAMDDIRYFVNTILADGESGSFYALSLARE